ncbi:MAG: transglutaminase-like domain-containing protein [Oscillospiraceae bacterium]|nr:transglutaminase-like domain-containing protein [Oscillospiraceae bacterium]
MRSKTNINNNNIGKQKYTPVIINQEDEQNYRIFTLRIVFKVLLICMITYGLCAVLTQYYKIPVSLNTVFSICCSSVIVFNIGLLFFKKRVILIPLSFFLLVSSPRIIYNFDFFLSHIMNTLNSRLLSTARFSKYPAWELVLMGNYVDEYIASSFMVLCILLSLAFTFAARSRLIGIILVTTVCLIAPAFGAEIAGYVPEIRLLIAGVLGIYATWASYAGFEGTINSDTGAKENKPERSKITPGKPPFYYKYSRNSLIVTGLALFASFVAAKAVPDAIKFDYKAILDSINSVRTSIVNLFDSPSKKVDDNGYFPNISSGANISMGLSLDRPPTGETPIIRVDLDSDVEKIFLKGGIGIDYTGNEWTLTQDSYDYRQMLEIIRGSSFYPEWEYQHFLNRKALSDTFITEKSLMLNQTITIEYLVRTGFLFLPTNPKDNDFKENKDYAFHGDTYISAKGRVNKTEFKTLYPEMSDFKDIISVSASAPTPQISRAMSSYRSCIYTVYTNVPEKEIENIDRLLEEANVHGEIGDFSLSSTWSSYALDFDDVFTHFDVNNNQYRIQLLNDYIKENYAYSLDVDNNKGGNTLLGNFLFENKSGHCVMYASAMTLAARRLGFPARYVTGIVTVPRAGKMQIFAEKDFHAWTEIYFENIGWLPFDPTGGVNGQEDYYVNQSIAADATAVTSETMPPQSTEPPETTATPAQNDNNSIYDSNTTVVLTITLIPLAIIITILILLHRYKKSKRLKFERFKTAGDNKTAAEMYRFILKLLRQRGIMPKKGESPLLFGERIDSEYTEYDEYDEYKNKVPPLAQGRSLSAIMRIAEKLEFGNIELTEKEYNCLYEYIEAIKAVKI